MVLYTANLYPRESPKLLFELDEEGLEIVCKSAWGVQEGCSLCHLGSSVGDLRIPKEEITKLGEPGGGATIPFIEGIVVLLPPEPSLNMGEIGTCFVGK